MRHDDATVAASDIARLAAVGRAAVSNWRRRYDDFPKPTGGTASSPLFQLTEVEEWLERHGKSVEVSPGDRIWQRLRATSDDLRLGDAVGVIGAFLVYLQREHAAWHSQADQGVTGKRLNSAIAKAVPELPGDLPDHVDPGLLHEVSEFAEQVGTAEAFDFFFDRYSDAHSRRLLLTPRDIAQLMIRLAGADEGSVLDPTCGLGTLLAATSGAKLALGQEFNETAARITAARLLLYGRKAEIAAGDSLRADAFPGRQVDAAVCNPPFSERSWGYEELASDPRWEFGLPPRSEPELAWVQHCLAHVKPGGRAVLMMPTAAAGRRSGRRVRANLLRAGAITAVITVTAGAGASSQAPDLWVLTRPNPGKRPPFHVLMVDASRDLTIAYRAWEEYLHDPDGAPSLPEGSRAMRVLDLLDDNVDLSPSRYLSSRASSVTEFADLRNQAHGAISSLATALPELSPGPSNRAAPTTTLGELIKAGAVTLYQAPIRTDVSGGSAPALTAKDVRVGRPPSGRAIPEGGTVVTEPGDVAVPIQATDTVARVLEDGGAILGPQLYLFRLDPARVDPHFLAGFIRAAGDTGLTRASSGSTRIDPRRTPIPRVTLEDQRRYGEAFRRLVALEDSLREVQALGESLVRVGFDGLVDGSLEP